MDYNRWPEPQPLPNPNPSLDPYAHYYNAQHHQHPAPSISHYPSYYPSPNPNPIPSHRVTPPAHSFASPTHTALAPPGAESYAALSSYQPPHVTYGGSSVSAYAHQAPEVGALSTGAVYYQDPVAPQSWAVKQAIRQYGADPVDYAAAIESLGTKSVVSSIPIDGIRQPVTNEVNKQTKVMQYFWCEVCRLKCNSKDVYDRHILGKKHRRNLMEQQLNKGSIVPAIASGPSGLGLQTTMGMSALVSGEDLETKRQKLMEGGASVDSVMVCALCNVVCNSQAVYLKHLAGRKHAVQASTRPPPNGLVHSGPAHPVPSYWTNAAVQPPFKSAMRRGGPKKRKIVQSAWCEVCKVDCTSKEVLDQHKLGKKHKRQVEKIQESKAKPNPAGSQTAKKPLIGPQEKPVSDKGKSKKKADPVPEEAGPQEKPVSDKGKSKKKAAPVPEEDVETKKRKILEGGAAADAVRICQACNVVCNSETVYNYHLAGQKHAANKKKMEAGEAATSAPLAVTSAPLAVVTSAPLAITAT